MNPRCGRGNTRLCQATRIPFVLRYAFPHAPSFGSSLHLPAGSRGFLHIYAARGPPERGCCWKEGQIRFDRTTSGTRRSGQADVRMRIRYPSVLVTELPIKLDITIAFLGG